MARITSTELDDRRLQSRFTKPTKEESLDACIRKRYSCRVFKPDPIPVSLLQECAALAQLAPSNSNIQNWRLTIASGKAKDRIDAELKAASHIHEPGLAKVPPEYQHYRNDLVRLVYGERGYDVMGEDRRDARQAKRMLQYEFFQAPTCAVITMDDRLGAVDAMSVGMYVQTFVLALTARGIGSCLQVSVTGFPDVLRRGFGLDDGQQILCGMAVGWPVEDSPVNRLVVERDPIENQVTFLQ